MYFPRTLESKASQISSQYPVMLITGPRQVGKTTFLTQLATSERKYVSLDDVINEKLAKSDPQLFLERYSPPVIIDEIQYAPGLLRYIKIYIDRYKHPGDFWLTGSQQFHLMKGVSESLAGRVGILRLQGLSHWETDGKAPLSLPFLPTQDLIQTRHQQDGSMDLMRLYKRIWQGSFPKIALDLECDWEVFYSSYIETYLKRDLRDLANVGDELAFFKFMQACAARTGQMLNLSELGRDIQISSKTAKHWLSILQTSGIIYLLEPYSNNASHRLIKTPKLYFLDTGLCSYLCRWTSPEALEAGAQNGAMFETYIVSEILKSYWHNGRSAPLYYIQDQNKKEIDILIEQNNTLYPIECKKTTLPDKNIIRHFNMLEHLKKPIGPGAIVCCIDKWVPITSTVAALPACFV